MWSGCNTADDRIVKLAEQLLELFMCTEIPFTKGLWKKLRGAYHNHQSKKS